MDYTTVQPYAECPKCGEPAGLSPLEQGGLIHYQYFCRGRRCMIDFTTPELQEEISNKCSTQQNTKKSDSPKT